MNSTKNKLLRTIRSHFPNLNWKSAKFISAGFDHDVIILDNMTVFRFPKNPHSKKLLKGEITLLNILTKQISTSIPAYIFIAKDYSSAGYPLIRGEGLTVKIYNSLSARKKNTLAKQIANFLTELHAVSSTKIKNCNIGERFAPQELKILHKDAKKHLYPSFSVKEKNTFESFFSELENEFHKKYKKVLIHGDFSGEHVILNDHKGLAGIIDLTDRALHDPAFDFLFFWEFGHPFLETVYGYYKGEKSGILERSNIYAQASAIWNMAQAVKTKKPNFKIWYRKFKRVQNQI